MVCHKGQLHHRAKLTEQEVREIRAKYRSGRYMQIQLAEEYAIDRNHLSKIVHGKLWKHL